jgi:hypothetical protein
LTAVRLSAILSQKRTSEENKELNIMFAALTQFLNGATERWGDACRQIGTSFLTPTPSTQSLHADFWDDFPRRDDYGCNIDGAPMLNGSTKVFGLHYVDDAFQYGSNVDGTPMLDNAIDVCGRSYGDVS